MTDEPLTPERNLEAAAAVLHRFELAKTGPCASFLREVRLF